MDIYKSKQIIFTLLLTWQLAALECYRVKLGRGNSHKSVFSSELKMVRVLKQLQHQKPNLLQFTQSVNILTEAILNKKIKKPLEKHFWSLTKEFKAYD